MSAPILETNALRKTFGPLVANDGISLSVEEGTIHGIVGPNGSGKSTFFNTVTGFYTPDRGTVTFDGTDITGDRPDSIARRGLGRTFQIASPFEGLTVRENLLAVFTDGLRSGIRIPRGKRARAQELLELLEIEHIADQDAGGISGGQEMLLELGRVLMLNPKCVLLDEPTAGVNPALQNRLLEHINSVREQGTTFVVIEHDMGVISNLCDTVTVFDQGQIITEGAFDAVTSDSRVRQAYLGGDVDADASIDDIVESAVEAEVVTADGPTVSIRETAGATTATEREIEREFEGDAWLSGENIVTGYGNHTVIKGVSVESRPGITCIFGPNGSGKSTLLKSLAGVVPVWEGTVRHRGVDITTNSPHQNVKRGINMLPQDGGIFGNMTVRENLLLGGYTAGQNRDERFDEALSAFPELEDKLNAKGASLSGGQQMMLSYGRAMMTGAELYLLDEPSSGLAPSLVDDVFEMTKRLVESGAQVLLIEQNVQDAMRIADYVYILAQGELQFEGEPETLTDEDELIEVYLGLE